MGRWKRALAGPRKLYRPAYADLAAERGHIHRIMERVGEDVLSACMESLTAAISADVDAFFTHDPFCAAHLLERRRADQQVWMMLHAPMPAALYHVWSWGVPEHDWLDLATLPDVRRWTEWEIDVCQRVDRLVLPCREAGDELVRADPRFGPVLADACYILTGAAGPMPSRPGTGREDLRRRFGLPTDVRVGLFIGNAEPYRGLDALLQALRGLPPSNAVDGCLAVAGPPADSLPRHPSLRRLGRVDDVSSLLSAVDFVVNVNRFSLFDLSTVEAVEAGKPLLLHAVGGNLTFRKLGAGCLMLDNLTPPIVAEGLRTMFSLPANTLRRLGAASRACYEAHLRPEMMWERHLELYDEMADTLLRTRA